MPNITDWKWTNGNCHVRFSLKSVIKYVGSVFFFRRCWLTCRWIVGDSNGSWKRYAIKLFWFKTMSHQSITRLRETEILKENANLKLKKKISCYRRMRTLLRLSFVAYTINFFPLLIIYHGSVKREKRVCSYPW